MNLSEFDYTLPEESIAKFPPRRRGSARLLVLSDTSPTIQHVRYRDVSLYLQEGDVVVLNDTKVIRARFRAVKENGSIRNLLLLEKHRRPIRTHGAFHHDVLSSGPVRPGDRLTVNGNTILVTSVDSDGVVSIRSPQNLFDSIDDFGDVPLPPYLKRTATENDLTRYQTVFARERGSVAAPTASLNITPALLRELKKKGVQVVKLTLHVGIGTFLPIRTETVEAHAMHREYFRIPEQTALTIRRAKEKSRKVLAVGTTVTRALEYASGDILDSARPQTVEGEADIFIVPGFRFRVTDMLLTNFHAPRTTVLLLASAFAGKEKLRNAYREALGHGYRFLSYGDSMLIR